MYSYALAFAILGGGVLLALVLWWIPVLRRRRKVRQFRKALTHVDVVAMAWSQALRHDKPFDDLPSRVPEGRRNRRHRHTEPDAGGSLA